jgi:tight adherence protein C
MIYLITAIVFASIMILTLALLYHFVLSKTVLLDRLQTLLPERKKFSRGIDTGLWDDKLARIGEKVKLPPQEHSKYMSMMVAAGYRKEAVYALFGWKVLLACAFPLLHLFFYAVPKGIYLTSQSLTLTAAGAVLGYLAPTYWVVRKKKTRQEQIFHTLPDILDLVTVCVEAGLSMDAALMRTTDTPQFDNDPLVKEIRTATMEVRAGKPRVEALKDMAERTMVDDVRAFVTMLAQTERFGTSLSAALRTYADGLRTKRRQMAEEAAAKTTIKMIFPLVIFVFPALLVVILGPAVVQIGKIFK